jgi:hypothetical protein
VNEMCLEGGAVAGKPTRAVEGQAGPPPVWECAGGEEAKG